MEFKHNGTKKYSGGASLNVREFIEFDPSLSHTEIREILKNANFKDLIVYAKAKLRPNEIKLLKDEISKRLDKGLDRYTGFDMGDLRTLSDLKIVQDDNELKSKLMQKYNTIDKGTKNAHKARNNAYNAWQQRFLDMHSDTYFPPAPVAPGRSANNRATRSGRAESRSRSRRRSSNNGSGSENERNFKKQIRNSIKNSTR